MNLAERIRANSECTRNGFVAVPPTSTHVSPEAGAQPHARLRSVQPSASSGYRGSQDTSIHCAFQSLLPSNLCHRIWQKMVVYVRPAIV